MQNNSTLFNTIFSIAFCIIVLFIARNIARKKQKNIIPGVTKIKMSEIYDHNVQNIFIVIFLSIFLWAQFFEFYNAKRRIYEQEKLENIQRCEHIKKVVEAYKNGENYAMVARNIFHTADSFTSNFIKTLVTEYSRFEFIKKEVEDVTGNCRRDSISILFELRKKCEEEKKIVQKRIKEAMIGDINREEIIGDFIQAYNNLIQKIVRLIGEMRNLEENNKGMMRLGEG